MSLSACGRVVVFPGKRNKIMAFDASKLKAYVDEKKFGLLKAAEFGTPSVQDFAIQTGIKSQAAINRLDVSSPLQDGSSCGFNASGDDTFSQRIIEVKPLKVNKEWCPKTLLKYWANYLVNAGAKRQDLPFEQYLTDEIVKNVQEQIEKIVWQGDTGLGIKGILGILGDTQETDVVKATFTGGQSAYDKVMAMYNAIPVGALDKAVVYLGMDDFRTFIQDMVAKNLYHYTAGEGLQTEFIIPGTGTKIKAAQGLNGTGKMAALVPDEVYVGCDYEDDDEQFDLFFSNDDRVWKLVIEFALGVQIYDPSRAVLGAEA